MSHWLWAIPIFLFVGGIGALAYVLTQVRPGVANPAPENRNFSAIWGKVRQNPLAVGVVSLLIVLTVVSIQYGGLGWLWINPKLTWSIALIALAIAILPAFKPNPGGTARRAIYLSIGLLLFWNFPIIGESLDLGQIFSPGAEPVGEKIENDFDITITKTSSPDDPLVVETGKWSKWVWLGSRYNWGVGSEDNRPFWIKTSSGQPQLHDPKNGKLAIFNAGQANRFASGDTKPLKLFFRRKGLAE